MNSRLLILILALVALVYAQDPEVIKKLTITFPETKIQSDAPITFTFKNDGTEIPRNTQFKFLAKIDAIDPTKRCRLIRQSTATDLPYEIAHATTPTSINFQCRDENDESFINLQNARPNCVETGEGDNAGYYHSFTLSSTKAIPEGQELTCYAIVAGTDLFIGDTEMVVEGYETNSIVITSPEYSRALAAPGEVVSKSKPWQFYSVVNATRPGIYPVTIHTKDYVWDTSIYDDDNFYCSGDNARVLWLDGSVWVHFKKAGTNTRCLFGIRKFDQHIITNTNEIKFKIYRDSLRLALITPDTRDDPLMFKGYVTSRILTVDDNQVHAPMGVLHVTIPAGTNKGDVFHIEFVGKGNDATGDGLNALIQSFDITSPEPNTGELYTAEVSATEGNRLILTANRANPEFNQVVTLLLTQTTPLDFTEQDITINMYNSTEYHLNSRNDQRIVWDYRTTWSTSREWIDYRTDTNGKMDPTTVDFGLTITPTHLNIKPGGYAVITTQEYILDFNKAKCTATADDNTTIRLKTHERLGYFYILIDTAVNRDVAIEITCDAPTLVHGYKTKGNVNMAALPANFITERYTEYTWTTISRDEWGPLPPPPEPEPEPTPDDDDGDGGDAYVIQPLQDDGDDGEPDDEDDEPQYPLLVTGWTVSLTVDLSKTDYYDFAMEHKSVSRAIKEFRDYLMEMQLGDVQSAITPFQNLTVSNLYYVYHRDQTQAWYKLPQTIYESQHVGDTSNYSVQLTIGIENSPDYAGLTFDQVRDTINEYFGKLYADKKIKYFLPNPPQLQWAHDGGLYPHCKGTDNLGYPGCARRFFEDKCTAHAQCFTGYCAPTGYCALQTHYADDLHVYSPYGSASMAMISSSVMIIMTIAMAWIGFM